MHQRFCFISHSLPLPQPETYDQPKDSYKTQRTNTFNSGDPDTDIAPRYELQKSQIHQEMLQGQRGPTTPALNPVTCGRDYPASGNTKRKSWGHCSIHRIVQVSHKLLSFKGELRNFFGLICDGDGVMVL